MVTLTLLPSCSRGHALADNPALGYDLSNVANIQATLYTTFGHIELLPFCALSYSMAHAAGAPLVRKISDFIDPRILIVSGAVVFSVGVIICGAAPTISAFIVGRTVSGLGGALLQQACVSPSLPLLPSPAAAR